MSSPEARPIEFDIAVVGAGAVGVCTAFQFSRAGYRVVLIDREGVAAGASSGNASHLAVAAPFPPVDGESLWKIPGMLLDRTGPLRIDWRYLPRITPWLLRMLWQLRPGGWSHIVRGLRRLNDDSTRAWKKLLNEIGIPDGLCVEGSIMVAETAAGDRELRASLDRYREWGVRTEVLTGDQLRELEPGLGAGVRGGLRFLDAGHFRGPTNIVDGVWKAAREAGCEWQQAEVQSVRVAEDGVRLETDGGEIRAGHVLIAAGAHSAPLVRQATGVRVPLDTERGYHLQLPAEQGRLNYPVASLERRFVMTPLPDGLRLAGTVEFAGLDRPADMRRAEILGRNAEGLLDTSLDHQDASTWMGFRPTLSDWLPVIDRTGPGRRVMLGFGHHHLGLTQAALTAELLVDLFHEREELSVPLAPYRLRRFGSVRE